jgi:hypothetical protein
MMTTPEQPPTISSSPSSVETRKVSWGWGFFGALCAYAASLCAILGEYPFISGALTATSMSCFIKVFKKEDIRGFWSILMGPPRS